MELNEAARRIIGQHWLLILLVVALGVGVAVLLHRGDEKTYTASTRLVLDTSDPESSQETAAIADAAEAIATSPAQVGEAFRRARISGRDPIEVAQDHVSVRALGASAVLRLSVSDRSPRVAVAISDALAAQLIRTRLGLAKGEVERVLAGLDRRLKAIDQEISRLDRTTARQLQPRPGPRRGRSRGAEEEEATRAQALRTSLAQRRAALEAERISLLSTDAVRPQPSIISAASPPADPDSSRLVPDMILGGLLGLVLGLGLAGFLETMRPTVVGGDALARELDAPLLGTLSSEPGEEKALQETGPIAERLNFAAEASAVHHVGLLPAGRPVDLAALAERLQANSMHVGGLAAVLEGPGSHSTNVKAVGGADSGVAVRAFGPHQPSLNEREATSLVLVSPTALRKAELANTHHLLRIIGFPLLGLITYAPSRWRWRRRKPVVAPEGTER